MILASIFSNDVGTYPLFILSYWHLSFLKTVIHRTNEKATNIISKKLF